MILLPILEEYKVKATIFISPFYKSQLKPLSLQEIKQLSQSPFVKIGSHTLNEKDLTTIHSLSELEKEITGSKNFLEDLTGKEIKYFAYPKGKFNPFIEKIVKKAGYQMAVNLLPHYQFSISNKKKINFYALPRICIS